MKAQCLRHGITLDNGICRDCENIGELKMRHNERYKHLKISATFLGYDSTLKRLQWLIRINDESFEYFQGIGHACLGGEVLKLKGIKRYKLDKSINKELIHSRSLRNCTDSMYIDYYAVEPQFEDVLYCLISDAECGGYSFNEFCDSFGYSNDSIKAFDVYKACMKTTDQLRRLKINVDAEREYLTEQGY